VSARYVIGIDAGGLDGDMAISVRFEDGDITRTFAISSDILEPLEQWVARIEKTCVAIDALADAHKKFERIFARAAQGGALAIGTDSDKPLRASADD
jgi:hypothetical protein